MNNFREVIKQIMLMTKYNITVKGDYKNGRQNY